MKLHLVVRDRLWTSNVKVDHQTNMIQFGGRSKPCLFWVMLWATVRISDSELSCCIQVHTGCPHPSWWQPTSRKTLLQHQVFAIDQTCRKFVVGRMLSHSRWKRKLHLVVFWLNTHVPQKSATCTWTQLQSMQVLWHRLHSFLIIQSTIAQYF